MHYTLTTEESYQHEKNNKKTIRYTPAFVVYMYAYENELYLFEIPQSAN